MKHYKWLILWDTLRASYWFIPILMTGAAIMLAFFTLILDQAGVAGPMVRLGLGNYYGGPILITYLLRSWGTSDQSTIRDGLVKFQNGLSKRLIPFWQLVADTFG